MPLPCKVCINRENSEKIQKELLKNNFRWVSPEKKVLMNVVCIFIYKDKVMSKEMREQIDKVKNWKQFLNENKRSKVSAE